MYAGILFALLVLMALTLVVAQYPLHDVVLGPLKLSGSILNNIVALTIAVIKATLVVLFFMHVKFSTKLTQLWVVLGFSWFFMLFLILLDYGTRSWEPVPTWEKYEGSSLSRKIGAKNAQEPVVRPRG
jgi:cytochrome c oxidase subunit 4